MKLVGYLRYITELPKDWLRETVPKAIPGTCAKNLTLTTGPSSTTTVLHVHSVPPHREGTCHELFWTYESSKCTGVYGVKITRYQFLFRRRPRRPRQPGS